MDMSILIVLLFLVTGILAILFSLNGIRVGRILGNVGWKMRVVKKDENPRAYWFSILGLFIYGVVIITLGVWIFVVLVF